MFSGRESQFAVFEEATVQRLGQDVASTHCILS